MALRETQEMAEYRALMEAPDSYEDGFGWHTVIGAFFIGFVMMPGSIYLGLVAGQTMGPAAEWTTIILFTEIARRSFATLSRQQIYILYYIAGGLTAMYGSVHLSGGPFAVLIWNQFMRASAPGDLINQVPDWVAPAPDSPAIAARTFLHADWAQAIGVLLLTQVFSRVAWFTLGYSLFRVLSDGEQLPFPLAPIQAQAATALAETSREKETWRWRVFSIGTMVGIGFGLVYLAVPTLTGAVLIRPVSILPIPWIDFTQGTERFLPGVPTGLGTNLATLMIGFVLPFWMVVGSFLAAVTTMIVNPIAQVTGHLPTWRPGMETTRTAWAASIDIWLSWGIGTAFAVAGLGAYKMVVEWKEMKETGDTAGFGFGLGVPGRADFRIAWTLGLFFLATTGYVVLSKWLVPDFPLIFLLVYGYIWTPLQSYINARMVGLTGQFVSIPMIREATFILSGYKGVDIWFAPIPLQNYGATVQRFREIELTGNRFTSVLKAELLMFPIMIVTSFLFWGYVWRLQPIPSVYYPYAQKMWDYQAITQWVWFSSTTEGGHQEIFQRAIKPTLMVGGLVFGLGTYAFLNWLRLPVMLIYGWIRGLGILPHFVILQFAGALIGRYYMRPRFGDENWRLWPPVLYAGFTCGMGLIAMLAIAIVLVKQSITQMPF